MAEKDDKFRYRVPPSLPAGVPVSTQEAEKILLQQLEDAKISDSESIETLWQLVWLYNSINRNDLAVGIIQRLLESADDTELQARCYLGLGQLAEQENQYDAAFEYYSKGLSLRPTDKSTTYFLHNNTGYCLNLQGKHVEAEHYCRLAIEIDSDRANAFKNLGISLAGQNDIVGASWAYVEATRANASDPRAFQLLEQLIKDHPELPSQYPSILQELEACRKAVLTAAEDVRKIQGG